jgi:hypothetical protein
MNINCVIHFVFNLICDIPILIADILNCSIKRRFEAYRNLFKLC